MLLLRNGTSALEKISTSNRILAQLSPADFAYLKSYLEPVELPLRQRVETPNKPIEYVYFVDTGIISVVAAGPRGQTIEVGVIGWEGCTGQPHLLGADRSPLDTYVQVAGRARRITIENLSQVTGRSHEFRLLLMRATYVFTMQVAFTALANGQATLNQRLARWLLMAHDRLQTAEITLTHEFLAIMLGVRRPGVTVTLADLQAQGLVKLRRGVVLIEDRAGLKQLAGKFYGVPEAELERILAR